MKSSALRTVARWLSGLVLKLFFRRIEVVGQEHVRAGQPVIYILNHPNGLIDPLFILVSSPGDVSFLAKEPLFRTPIVKYIVKAFDCLPVYRKQDGADTKQNIRTMGAARDLLARNGSLAMFPEGITHHEPELQPLKTGAARIALAARAMLDGNDAAVPAVKLVPVGLYYSAKGTFRSDAVVVYGEAMDVPLVALDDDGGAPRDAVRALTARIDAELRALTVNAQDAEHVALAATAARLLQETASVAAESGTEDRLYRRLALMQRILTRYDELRNDASVDLAALITRLRNYQSMVSHHGVSEDLLSQISLPQAVRHFAQTLLGTMLALPFVVVGVVENYIPYRIVGHLAHRASRGSEEVMSTLKVLGGLLLFPMTWLVWSVGVLMISNWVWAAAHLVFTPVFARAALWFFDRVGSTVAGARVLWLMWLNRHQHSSLMAERDAIAAQLLGIGTRPY